MRPTTKASKPDTKDLYSQLRPPNLDISMHPDYSTLSLLVKRFRYRSIESRPDHLDHLIKTLDRIERDDPCLLIVSTGLLSDILDIQYKTTERLIQNGSLIALPPVTSLKRERKLLNLKDSILRLIQNKGKGGQVE